MNEHIFWLAINIYHEARGETLEGQLAVGHVCMNRAIKSHTSVTAVILKPWQFSWHNHKAFPPIDDYDALRASLHVAGKVIEERLDGKNLWGADHYFGDYIDPPKWAKDMKEICKIGRHIFYKDA